MAKDFQQKEPSKMEKVAYQLAMDQENIRHNLWTTSAFVTAVAMLTNVDPEKVAELLTKDNAKIQEYSKKVNEAINKIEQETKAKEAPKNSAKAEEGESHEGHDHSHEGHNHPHA